MEQRRCFLFCLILGRFFVYLGLFWRVAYQMLRERFLGEFEEEKYVVRKQYLDSKLRNVRLYHTKFTPANPKRTIAVIHGFGEHSGRFYDIAHFFAIHQFEVLLVDFTGFGYSGGPRGCATLEILENDVITLLGQARQDLPLYMYAHSLGGLTTIKLLLDRPLIKVSGCILTSPLLGIPKDRHISKIKLWIVKELGDELEDLIVNSMINPTALTKNNKYMHNIFEDRLMIPFVGVKMAKSILESLKFVKQNMDNFTFPVIVFHGKKDSVVDFQDSKKFVYNKLAPYKQIHLFDNGYHEMQHDEEKDELLERGLRFLESLPAYMVKPAGAINYKDLEVAAKPKKNPLKSAFPILAIIAIIIGFIRVYRKLRK